MTSDIPQRGPEPQTLDEKSRAAARLGQTVKHKYRLDALLGVGGMATVFSATHRNGSRVALKILHAEFARDASIRERFLKEGYVANKVDHPGRVTILDDDITEEQEPFLVMELLEGETLQQLWKRLGRKAPLEQALSIAARTLEVLQAFHDAGVIHRDIKPANVFVTKLGEVKVLDFGVARLRDPAKELTRAGTALGTPSFMAPEQARGLADGVDGRADLFSVGATLYAILGGSRLHQGRSDNEAFILAATQPAPSLARVAPGLPVEVIALVDRALAWDPRNRFQSALEMAREIERVLAELRHDVASPQSVPEPTQPPASRFPSNPATSPPITSPPITSPPITSPPITSPPITSPARAHSRGPAAERGGDPAVARLVDTFRRIERLLPTVRQYGWAHPESENKLRVAFQGLVDALSEDPSRVCWTLQPYSFLHEDATVWEPSAPIDSVPYNLFAAGVRAFRVRVGVTAEQLKALCEVFLIDPHKDLSPEDDVASALWERRLTHIQYDVIHLFAEGDAAAREAFYEEADELEALASSAAQERANKVEAMAMPVLTTEEALQARWLAGQALSLDAVARKALASQIETNPEQWSERFIDVIVAGFADAMNRGDTVLVLDPLDASSRDLVLLRRFDLFFKMWGALVDAVERRAPRELAGYRRELTRGMVGPETLRLLLAEATRVTQNVLTPLGFQEQLLVVNWEEFNPSLVPVLHELGSEHVAAVLAVIDDVNNDGLRRELLSFLSRTASGCEAELEKHVPLVSIETMRTLLRLLASLATPEARTCLERLSTSSNPTVRCESMAYTLGSPELLGSELQKLTESPQIGLRAAALRTMAFHQIRSAGPLLAKRIQDPAFSQLDLAERREIVTALYAIFPQRAEQIAIEVVQKHGLLVDEALEQTRALCAELLGQRASTLAALEAVLAASKRRWWNTQPLRETATVAAEAIAARLGRHISPNGDIV